MTGLDHNLDQPADRPRTLGKRMVSLTITAGVVVLAGIGVGTLVATQPKPEKRDEAPIPMAVQVAPGEAVSSRISITAQGLARPRTQADMAAQVGGRIVWVNPNFADGGSFRTGETLARIERADYENRVISARAQVAQAEEAMAREEAAAELARRDWAELGRGEPSPLAVREPQLAQARAALAAAQAQLRTAELDLARTEIKAPFDGRVMTRRATVGDSVNPGAPIAQVFATDVMEVRIPLTDADMALLQLPVGFTETANRRGPSAHLDASVAGANRRWEGRLTRIDAAVDAQSRVVYGYVEVRAPFGPNQPAPLAPGLFVTAHLDGAREEQFVAAPRAALKRNEFIYVVGPNDTLAIRQVRPAQTNADQVFLREGLGAGERVVVSFIPSPREGMKVTPMVGGTAEAPPAEVVPASAR